MAQVTLKLVTDIDSTQAAEGSTVAGAAGPSGMQWQYTGAISLVKSALQKNVRLGRTAEAVRCPLRMPAGALLWENMKRLVQMVICLRDTLLSCSGALRTCWPRMHPNSCAGPPSSPWR